MMLSFGITPCAAFFIGGISISKQKTENQFLNKILKSSEKVGISKTVIERFILFYGKEVHNYNVKPARSTERVRGSH